MSFDTILISPGFFGYANEIINELQLRGRSVLYFQDRPNETNFTKAVIRVSRKIAGRSIKSHAEIILKKAKEHSPTVTQVIVIKGEAISVELLTKMRDTLENAKFIVYFWDSYKNMPKETFDKVGLFHKAYSFDLKDCKRDARLTYRPLFFSNTVSEAFHVEKDIDFLFLGTVHSDRYSVIKRVGKVLPPTIQLVKFMYYPSRGLFLLKRIFNPIFWGSRIDEFSFVPLSREQSAQLMARAKVSLDIERTVQTGLTMRCIELLGSGRKLVTTNSLVKEADFYHPDNICVIDRFSPVVPQEFFSRPFVPVESKILNRYTLAGWLDDIL